MGNVYMFWRQPNVLATQPFSNYLALPIFKLTICEANSLADLFKKYCVLITVLEL